MHYSTEYGLDKNAITYKDSASILEEADYTVSQKVPTFTLSVTLSNVNRFSKLLHCWKAYEICYKTIRHYPSQLRLAATLPCEIKNANFLHTCVSGAVNLVGR